MADSSITTWIGELKAGHQEAAQKLWERYALKLAQYANRNLVSRRVVDGEDIFLSAFHSFLNAVEENRFPQLNDRNDLWQILVMLTARKASKQRAHDRALKRGGGLVRGDSVLEDEDCASFELIDEEPTVEFSVMFAELVENLMNRLQEKDVQLSRFATMKMEGHTNRQIAEQCGCAERTVERKLSYIREIWTHEVDCDTSA